jgi:hypothetical protein
VLREAVLREAVLRGAVLREAVDVVAVRDAVARALPAFLAAAFAFFLAAAVAFLTVAVAFLTAASRPAVLLFAAVLLAAGRLAELRVVVVLVVVLVVVAGLTSVALRTTGVFFVIVFEAAVRAGWAAATVRAVRLLPGFFAAVLVFEGTVPPGCGPGLGPGRCELFARQLVATTYSAS